MTEIRMPQKPESYFDVTMLMKVDRKMDVIEELMQLHNGLTRTQLIGKLTLEKATNYSKQSSSGWVGVFLIDNLLEEETATDNKGRLLKSNKIRFTKAWNIYHKCVKDYIKEGNKKYPNNNFSYTEQSNKIKKNKIH
jgi:hypothetical protein